VFNRLEAIKERSTCHVDNPGGTMSSHRLGRCVLLFAVLATTGCATKITLGPIDEGLEPQVKLAGRVHVMPVRDTAHLAQFGNGYFSTISGAAEGIPYISESRPADAVEKSIASCLTQSGLIVTSGQTVPADADIVLSPNLKALYIGHSAKAVGYAIAATLITGMATTSDPHAEIMVLNGMEDRKSQARTEAVFVGSEQSFRHFTKGGGAERSFRLVQEKYCDWLQQKIAGFRADPVAADRVNTEEASAFLKTVKK
jgi:hypothetical protein